MELVEIKCRCKDCKHAGGFDLYKRLYCYWWDYEQGMEPNTVEELDFCSNGECK